jgi:hypothetical protein
MFGRTSLIERMDKELVLDENYLKPKQNNHLFYTGGLYIHDDPDYGVYRNRKSIYEDIKNIVYNPGHLSYQDFIHTLRNSKFSIDLLGVGDPNMRTIEIVMSGSLMISQKNNLKWPFPEEFSKETQFENKEEFFQIINELKNNEELYNQCLQKQYQIVKKYFNKTWIKDYILSIINLYE